MIRLKKAELSHCQVDQDFDYIVFEELLPSEKALVIKAQYEKACMNNQTKLDVASEYGFSSRNARRYIRLNYLIEPLQNMVDNKKIAVMSSVELSYLSKEEQYIILEIIEAKRISIGLNMAKKLHKLSGTITKISVESLFEDALKDKYYKI